MIINNFTNRYLINWKTILTGKTNNKLIKKQNFLFNKTSI